jgi:hypothetical protein
LTDAVQAESFARMFSNALQKVSYSVVILFCSYSLVRGAEWKVQTGDNKNAPGQKIDFTRGNKVVARFIYGEGQYKPYLHVFGEDGELLTNSGLDESGKPTGQFPHHRGIFIGWKVTSELGTDDLWHMTKGCKLDVQRIEKTSVNSTGWKEFATLVATVAWRAGKKDAAGSDLLLTETRTLSISRPEPKQTMIDATFVLNPARDVSFGGDLQHAGVHFRASNEVATRAKETSYLFEPDKVVKGDNLKWVRLLFPIGSNWYTAMEMNAPSNPVEELSMRDYGRFGYFFKKDLKKSEPLTLKYRFVIGQAHPPAAKPQPSPEQIAASKRHCEHLFASFLNGTE